MTDEIFARVAAHQLEGVMFHSQMADMYDFLGLDGFRTMHEHRFREEIGEHRRTCKYFTEHYSRLLPEADIRNPGVIPDGWRNHVRQDMDTQTLRKAVEEGHERWVAWETATKSLYETAYRNLMSEGTAAGAIVVGHLVEGVDIELAEAERQLLDLRACEFDLPTIVEMQERYRRIYSG